MAIRRSVEIKVSGDTVTINNTTNSDSEVMMVIGALERHEQVVYKADGKTKIIPYHSVQEYTVTVTKNDDPVVEPEDDFCVTGGGE